MGRMIAIYITIKDGTQNASQITGINELISAGEIEKCLIGVPMRPYMEPYL
jgi:hypothetical protein